MFCKICNSVKIPCKVVPSICGARRLRLSVCQVAQVDQKIEITGGWASSPGRCHAGSLWYRSGWRRVICKCRFSRRGKLRTTGRGWQENGGSTHRCFRPWFSSWCFTSFLRLKSNKFCINIVYTIDQDPQFLKSCIYASNYSHLRTVRFLIIGRHIIILNNDNNFFPPDTDINAESKETHTSMWSPSLSNSENCLKKQLHCNVEKLPKCIGDSFPIL